MAKKTKQAASKVTRIKASDTKKAAQKTAKTTAPKVAAKSTATHSNDTSEPKNRRQNPLSAIGEYFKGSWYELKQVRWPDRRTTWSMTGALLAFTAFFVLIILLLDAGFAKLFNILLGK